MSEKLQSKRGSANVFRDLGFEGEEAENLKLRSELMMRIEDFHKKSGMTQAETAKVLGLSASRMSAVLNGKIGAFSIDSLVTILGRAGLRVEFRVRTAA